jgi:3',5'-nucleoside bisphosphate phosphatase
MAREHALQGLAFTDHMDISSVEEGIRLAPSLGLHLFSGVEISTVSDGKEFHLLIYGFHTDDESLKNFLDHHSRTIWDKAHEVLDIFSKMGFDIKKEDIQSWGHSVPTGVTFLNALIRRNRGDKRLQKYLSGPKASSPYLNFYQDYALGDIGTIVRSALPDLIDTMRLLKGSGVFILAHPGDAGTDFLKGLKDEGLTGIEAYSTHHTAMMTDRLLGEARSLNLLLSAGSDFHGERIKPLIHLGDMSGQPDERLISMLKDMTDQ